MKQWQCVDAGTGQTTYPWMKMMMMMMMVMMLMSVISYINAHISCLFLPIWAITGYILLMLIYELVNLISNQFCKVLFSSII